MIRISMPDPLTWETGIAFGLQALPRLTVQKVPFECLITDRGPQFEEVAFSIYQLDLDPHVKMVPWVRYRSILSDILLFPRLCGLETQTIQTALKLNKTVLTSDPDINVDHPNLHRFHRRDYPALADLLLTAAELSPKVAAPEKI